MTAYTPRTVWIGRKPNAFTLPAQGIQVKPTRISKKAATRVNKNAFLAAHSGMTNSQKAPR